MHDKTLTALLTAALIAFGCGGSAETTSADSASASEQAAPAAASSPAPAAQPTGNESLTMSLDGETYTLDQEWGGLVVRRNAMIYITNYDPGEDPSVNDLSAPLSDGQIRVTLNLLGIGGDGADEFRLGDYTDDGAEQKLNYVGIEIGEGGETVDKEIQPTGRQGPVTILAYDGTTMSGEVDVSHNENSLEGTFWARDF